MGQVGRVNTRFLLGGEVTTELSGTYTKNGMLATNTDPGPL